LITLTSVLGQPEPEGAGELPYLPTVKRRSTLLLSDFTKMVQDSGDITIRAIRIELRKEFGDTRHAQGMDFETEFTSGIERSI
jgi:hypothetical protein